MAEIKVEGLRELNNLLTELPRRISVQVLRRALMDGAKPIVGSARSLAPVLKSPDPRRTPGLLKAKIRARPVRDPEHTATVVIDVPKLTPKQIARFKKKHGKSGAKNPRDAFYWLWQELGTSKMPAHSYLRPAFEAKKLEAVDVTRQRLTERIAIEAEKLRRK